MKVVITGATGFIGKPLVQALRARGDDVTAVSRDGAAASAVLGVPAVTGNLEASGAWQAALRGVDAVVHLAGESIAARRWDARQKQMLRDSRVESTRNIVEGIRALPETDRPRTLVVASGADYYEFAALGRSMPAGFDEDPVTEADPYGDHFLGKLCRDWEDEARAGEALGMRVVRMRTGIVLGPGGAFAKMATAFKLFAGGPLGSGKQWFSWIHLDDAVAAYLFALDHAALRGPVNLVAPGVVRQKTFAAAMGHALHRPALLPTPGFALRAAVGKEFAEYLLNGRKVVPAALQQAGFTFRYGEVAAALATLAKS